jgi:mRNA interferase HicA
MGRNISVDDATYLLYSRMVTCAEFKRWLEKQGCSVTPGRGSHLKVRSAQGSSILPMHGKKEIGKGLVAKIKKDLGLK